MDSNIIVLSLYSKRNNMKRDKFVVISPDGFPIHFRDTYSSIKKAEEALNVWIKNYERQGYYSSVNWGRIPLNELNYYCQIKQLN